MWRKLKTFANEVGVEFSKVNWPTRDELIRSTGVVLVFSIAFAIFIGIFDWTPIDDGLILHGIPFGIALFGNHRPVHESILLEVRIFLSVERCFVAVLPDVPDHC